MCGIIGYIGPRPVVPLIIEGLRKLEYRGYDSAGIAVVSDGVLTIRRSAGKLANLETALASDPLSGDYGLGHTRWATHGRPTEENAHPHRDCNGRIVVVHNGIIENYLELKRELQSQGHTLRHRDRHRGGGPPGRARVARRRARRRRAPGDDAAEGPVRAGDALGRRPVQDRRRPQRPAGGGRPRRRRVLRGLRHPGDPRPHPQRRVPGRPGDGGGHARAAPCSRTSTATPSPRRPSASPGIRSRPRRPATSTSCSRRSSSSRRPCATPCWAASRSRPARSSRTRPDSTTRCCAP